MRSRSRARQPHRARAKRSATRAERLRLFLPGRSAKLQLLAICVAVLLALSSQSFASAREAATYLIQPGDTLMDIAKRTGVSLERLMGLNSIQNPDVITAGKVLNLESSSGTNANPSTSNTSSTPVANNASARYTVRDGDTLWDISVSNSIAFDELIKLNHLDDADQLTVGQQLVIPARAAQRAATATPKPQATTRPRTAISVQDRVAGEVFRVGGSAPRVGVSALNLKTGERVSLRADERFPSASVMKLPILVELERQIAAGKLAWNDKLRAQAASMMSVSDNVAADAIADAVTPQAVNANMANLGLKSTQFLNFFSSTRSQASPGQNQTTPANMSRLLELIANDQIVSAAVSADIRAFLARNSDRSKLVRLLPSDARVAHKSGWYDGVANDVGIVTVESKSARWVISVFSHNVADAETGNQLVAAISRAVYDAWAGD